MSYTEEEFYKFVGEKIRITRQAAGMNQETLAKEVDLQRTSITNIEAGNQKVQIYTLFEIAAALRVPIFALLPPTEIQEVETNKEDLLLKQAVLADNGTKGSLSEAEVKNILRVLK